MDVRSGESPTTYKIGADIAWTRDMSRIYFLRIQEGLFKRDVHSQSEELLYAIPKGQLADKEGFRLSPDERWIALAVISTSKSALLLVPAGGGPARVLFQSKREPHVAGWTQDGNTILFTMQHSWDAARLRETRGLWGISAAGGTPRSYDFVMENLHGVRVAPDGHRIVFTQGYPYAEIWIMPALLPGR